MAKGLRSSVKKSNRTKLRANVFQPVETARAERIHQKILETLQQPKPEPPKKAAEMEVDSTEDTTAEPTEGEFPKEMEVDGAAARKPLSNTQRKKKEQKRVSKHKKPRNQISFPKSKGKGALKPFSESRSRVTKRR